MMKAEVDYKHPKKMKKRRQLDALVDNVKLPRSRKNSAHELLENHSDSSDVVDFAVSSADPSRKKCCFCESIVSRITILVLSIACLSTCIGVIWVQWHVRHELSTLRDQIATVQKSDTTSQESMMKMQGKVNTLNHTVLNLQTGPGSLTKLSSSIADIQTELKNLNKEESDMKKDVKSLTELMDTPQKISAMANTLQSMQAAIDSAKETQKNLSSRVTALEAMVSSPTHTLEPTKQSKNFLDEQLRSVNATVNEIAQSLNNDFVDLKRRVSSLETSGSPGQEDIQRIVNEIVAEKVSDMVRNMSLSQGDASTNQNLKTLMDEVTKALQQVTQKLSRTEFVGFKEETAQNFERINSTLHAFNGELSLTGSQILNLEAAVNNITEILSRQKTESSVTSDNDVMHSPSSSSTLEKLLYSSSTTSTADTHSSDKAPTQPMSKEDVTGSNSPGITGNTSVTFPKEDTTNRHDNGFNMGD